MGLAGHNFSFGVGGELHFQEGPVKEHGKNGTQADEVLEAVVSYLKTINVQPHASREGSLAITKIEEAIHWLNARTADRVDRGVEGTNQP